MIERRLRELWDNLQGKKPHLPHFLSEIRLDGIRGLNDLRVLFDYPVSVIAGGNATGKSTVLFAAACAYTVPDKRTIGILRPSRLFPDIRPEDGGRGDEWGEVTIDFDYLTPEGGRSMQWRRSKHRWSPNFFGRKNASQPERQVYLRTLSNLKDLSRVNASIVLRGRRGELEETPLTRRHRLNSYTKCSRSNMQRLSIYPAGMAKISSLLRKKVVLLTLSCKWLLGERAILLRLSKEIAQLDGALVLIDEVEAGLHPWMQQQILMLHLQQLALRNDLQIIVTSHSPVVLDSVPATR